MQVAVIDLGTNTFHLLIAEIANNSFEVIYKTTTPVKLGEGRINENIIIPEAFERGLQTLQSYKNTINSYQVKQIKATATSAVRSAKNGQDFIKSVKETTNIDIEIISGDAEAAYIYEGVKASGAIEKTSLIMDIGGGSVEFIICDNNQIYWKKSYNIGAARLMQQFFKSDPICKNDQTSITNYLKETLYELVEICAKHQPQLLIGSAGAFETFAEVIILQNQENINVNEIKCYDFRFEDYSLAAQKIINSNHQERMVMPGIITLRVDMIVMAAILTNYVLEATQIRNIKLSTFDLKMGVLASLAR